ncbi:uncharacterized protein LOC143192402 [Rhynchophorus ferrugineus]|uniref:uncharacterized protein LOC143192402 n=1 Tax=Rhynchophorus ferrugineus TaxID=354439 RepID=UPI003FCE563E
MARLLPRNNVYLDEEVKEEYPTATVSADPSCIDFRNYKNLLLVCYHCGSHNLSYGNKFFWHHCASFQHFYCYYCFDYSLKRYHHTCVDGEPIHDETRTVEHLLYGRLKFECLWPGCNKIFGGSTLKSHEMSCEFQPERQCPVRDCPWKGTLDAMHREHFKEHENYKLIFRNVILKLDSNVTYFLLILNQFVRVEYTSQQLGEVHEHQLNLEVVQDNQNYNFNVKPVGLLSTKHLLLKKIEGKDAVKSLRKSITLFVYLE